jgi:DNA polymerase III delta prime subunit
MPLQMDASLEAELIELGLATAADPIMVNHGPEAEDTARPSQVPFNGTPHDPTMDPVGYVRPSWWNVLEWSLTKSSKRGAKLMGPAGTGKTTAVHSICRHLGKQLFTSQFSEGTTIDDLIGVNSLADGKTFFNPCGKLSQALFADGVYLIEEPNTKPGVLSAMHTLIDGSGDSLSLPDGTSIPVGPNFRLVLCLNPGYTCTRELNPALTSRLTPIFCDYLPQSDESAVLCARTGIGANLANQITQVAKALRNARADIQFDCSPRSLFEWIDFVMNLGMSWQEAFEASILNEIGDPATKGPQRDVAKNIAVLTGLDQIGSA